MPRLSFRKLVPLAIDGPDIAPARYPIKPLLILLSNITGSYVVYIFFGFKRFNVLFAADVPISLADRKSEKCLDTE